MKPVRACALLLAGHAHEANRRGTSRRPGDSLARRRRKPLPRAGAQGTARLSRERGARAARGLRAARWLQAQARRSSGLRNLRAAARQRPRFPARSVQGTLQELRRLQCQTRAKVRPGSRSAACGCCFSRSSSAPEISPMKPAAWTGLSSG